MINLNAIFEIAIASIMMWFSSIYSMERKDVLLFLPFLIFGIIACFNGALILIDEYNIELFSVINYFYFFLLVWIFVNIRRIF
jgi:hypothetical protein